MLTSNGQELGRFTSTGSGVYLGNEYSQWDIKVTYTGSSGSPRPELPTSSTALMNLTCTCPQHDADAGLQPRHHGWNCSLTIRPQYLADNAHWDGQRRLCPFLPASARENSLAARQPDVSGTGIYGQLGMNNLRRIADRLLEPSTAAYTNGWVLSLLTSALTWRRPVHYFACGLKPDVPPLLSRPSRDRQRVRRSLTTCRNCQPLLHVPEQSYDQ